MEVNKPVQEVPLGGGYGAEVLGLNRGSPGSTSLGTGGREGGRAGVTRAPLVSGAGGVAGVSGTPPPPGQPRGSLGEAGAT